MPNRGAPQYAKLGARPPLTTKSDSAGTQFLLSNEAIQRSLHHPDTLSQSEIIALQRTVGNQTVQRMIYPTYTKQSSTPQSTTYQSAIQRSSPSKGKLRVGPAHDSYEQEAHTVAQRVVGPSATVQRKNNRSLPHAVQPDGGPIDSSVEQQITQAQGSGRPLETTVRRQMEDALGMDLAKVRVHTDPRADRINRALSATASTHRADIFFREGAYQPHTTQGRQVLAHEITHVAQQTGGSAPGVVQRLLPWTSRDVSTGDEKEPALPGGYLGKTIATEREMIKQLDALLDQYHSLSMEEKTSKVGLSWLEAMRRLLDTWFAQFPKFLQYEQYNPNAQDHYIMLEALGHALDFEINKIASKQNSKLKNLKKLSGGKMGGAFKAKKGLKSKVWKEDLSSYGNANAPSSIGIKKWGANLSARSVASSDVNKALLGKSGVITRTKFGVHGGKIGQLQDFVKGGKPLEDIKKQERAKLYSSNWKVLRDLQHMQMIDYITGQADRHWGNIMITKSGAVGIDSDFSFGTKKMDDLTDGDRNQYIGGVHNKGLPQFITKQFARKIMKMDESTLEKLVKSKLLPEELDAAKANLRAAQYAIGHGLVQQLDNKPKAWLAAFNQIDPKKSYLYGYKRPQQGN